jgi:nucleotide-binding universal stress UspA family protein
MDVAHVLVAAVGDPDEDAIRRAATVHDADRVTVFDVVTPLDAGMSEGGIVEREERLPEAQSQAAERAETAREATDPDTTVEATATSGRPVETVVDRAADGDVDAIVVDGVGGPAVLRRLFGTNPQAIATEAPVPVTVLD